HVLADGGRTIKTTRTDYAEHLGRDDMAEIVRAMMKEQHKAMFISLRAGELDALLHPGTPAAPAVAGGEAASAPKAGEASGTTPQPPVADGRRGLSQRPLS